MAIRDEFAQQPESVQRNFEGMYGESAPFFWAAQSDRLRYEGPATEFFNLPPEDQATWYGMYGEDAGNVWAQQAGKTGGPGPAPAPTAGPVVNPRAPTGPVGTGKPGEDFNYGPVGAGAYPGKPGVFGAPSKNAQTVAASTWGKASPGRNEGWGSIGAGTAGQQYGWGVPGFGQEPIRINPNDLPHLFNERLSPGYIPGSGTYNQFRLDTQDQKPRFPGGPVGLFQTLPTASGGTEVVNSRFGQGGTGDPTTGGERQTARRYITGNPNDSGTSEMGDDAWRNRYGAGGGRANPMAGLLAQRYAGGGGVATMPQPMPQQPQAPQAPQAPQQQPMPQPTGMPAMDGGAGPPPGMAEAMGAAGGQQQPQEPQPMALPFYQTGYATGGGSDTPYGVGGAESNNGNAAHFFATSVTSNWGQTAETAGLDFMANLFLRPDTPTGIGTPAAAAPASMWNALANEIRNGRIWVTNPLAWQMLQEHGHTPQSIGGQATGGRNVTPSGQPATGGTGAGGTDTGISGTWKEGEMTPLGPIKGGLINGFDLEYNKLLQDVKYRAGMQAIEEAKLTGKFNGLDTLEAQKLAAEIKDQAEKNAIARINADANMKAAITDEAYKKALTQYNIDKLAQDAGIATGYIGDKATVDMQRLLAEQQQAAYARAANPAMAFENEYARGATGWNTGNTAGMAGVPGMTTPGQTVDQFGLAGGWAPGGTPTVTPGQPTPAPTTAQAAPITTPAVPQPGQPGYQPPVQQQTGASNNLFAQKSAAQPSVQPTAQPAGVNPTEQVAGQTYAGNTTQPGAAGAGAAESSTAQAQAAQAAGAFPGAAATGVNIRTPAAVQAFKQGTGMASSGNYGNATGQVEDSSVAPISGAQVRLQNLKQTRKLSPVARAVVGSFAGAGGTDKDTFKMYSEKAAPGAKSTSGSYSMR